MLQVSDACRSRLRASKEEGVSWVATASVRIVAAKVAVVLCDVTSSGDDDVVGWAMLGNATLGSPVGQPGGLPGGW